MKNGEARRGADREYQTESPIDSKERSMKSLSADIKDPNETTRLFLRLLFSLIIFSYSQATLGQEGAGGEAPV